MITYTLGIFDPNPRPGMRNQVNFDQGLTMAEAQEIISKLDGRIRWSLTNGAAEARDVAYLVERKSPTGRQWNPMHNRFTGSPVYPYWQFTSWRMP